MMMDTTRISKTKDSFMNNIVKTVFKSAGCGFNFELMYENLFKDTKYKYIGDNKFLHFTSAENLIRILESGSLRMSDFNNLADKNEFVYGLKVFGESFSSYKICNINEKLFCLSACKSKEQTQKDLLPFFDHEHSDFDGFEKWKKSKQEQEESVWEQSDKDIKQQP